ncbi:MAG: ABC transporter permease [Flavisolibacter sp.]
MFNHLFKLSWNKKKQNFLIIVEVFASFIVLFAVFSLLISRYINYKQPMGFTYENVWSINIFPEDRGRNWGMSDSTSTFHEPIDQALSAFPEVKSYSYSNFNTPFSMGEGSTMVELSGNKQQTNFYITDDRYLNTLDMTLLEGRWYDKKDEGLKETPVVINKSLKEKLFKNENPIGKTLITGMNGEQKLKVVGVVSNFKDKGDFIAPDNGLFMRMNEKELKNSATILVKMQDGSSASVEARLQKTLSNAAKNTSIQIAHLNDQRITKNKTIIIPMIILFVICGFLIFNVGLGLFGILWYNINKRKSEIGLRRAIGATERKVSAQLIGEALIMATIAMIIAIFFAVQFPLLHVFDLDSGVYIGSILLSTGFIYLLVLICAFYPGKQASQIQPAVVLHEE